MGSEGVAVTSALGDAPAAKHEPVSFELVVLRRRIGFVDICVQGMTSSADVELVVSESLSGPLVVVVGSRSGVGMRPFELTTRLSVFASSTIELVGRGQREVLAVSDLPHVVPLVCGVDPFSAGLAGDFLHRRASGDVLMSGADAWSTSTSTTKVA